MNRGMTDSALACAQGPLLCAVAASLPWDLLQRLPFLEFTISKAAAALFIVLFLLRFALFPRWRVLRTGLELPGLVFMLLMAASLPYSLDRTASLQTFAVLLQYVVFFYAMLHYLRLTPATERVLGVFLFSSALAALPTIAAVLGWSLPMFWEASEWTDTRPIELWRQGQILRVAGTGVDFNLCALPLLLAFAAGLFLLPRMQNWRHRGGMLAAQALLLGGIVATQSRSALAVVFLFLLIFVAVAGRRHKRLLVTAALPAALVLGILASMPNYRDALVRRIESGLTRPNPSNIGRWATYGVALDIAPQHLLIGTGIGASDEAMRQRLAGQRFEHMTIHSVPLKLLLETGALGFAAYLWLWGTAGYLLFRRRRTLPLEDARRTAAIASMLAVWFLFTLVQPLLLLMVYPFILGLAFGPSAATERATPALDSSRLSRALCGAAVVVVLVGASANLLLYQVVARHAQRAADALTLALEREARADWPAAQAAYQLAAKIFEPEWVLAGVAPPPEEPGAQTSRGLPLPLGSLSRLPYYDVAAEVSGQSYVLDDMNVGLSEPEPASVALYGCARVALAQGELQDGVALLRRALSIEPRFAAVSLLLAEALWEADSPAEALEYYRAAADLGRLPENEGFGRRMARIEERLHALGSNLAPTVNELLERARLLRQLGRWDEAVSVYADLVKTEAPPVDAVRHAEIAAALEQQIR